ncbi:neuronal pentraxin-2-like [Dendronephthya gigantea]|uniref:neuronal pentraxin-2-like n=1 Tax=Dendronephthya gigantea TaxID=151771 RepID=UPI00106A03B6|nr:neuronal pentraxin-2-like [Dendronephthya gigantea]
MDFPQASVENYVKIENAIRDKITVFSLCLWAKISRNYSSIFAYSSQQYDSEIAVFLYENLALDLAIKKIWSQPQDGPTISAYDSWHFYCLQWRNNDGLIEIYQDGIKLGTKHKAVGYTIPSNGIVVIGQELDSYGGGFDSNEAFQGSLASLNLWRKFLTVNVIQGMASGVINVNGDLFQWRNLRNHVFGHVNIRERSEAEIPEYRVQILRNEWCGNNVHEAFTYARFIRSKEMDGYTWRCVTPAAMLDENMCYDITKNSTLYYTRNKKEELLGIN